MNYIHSIDCILVTEVKHIHMYREKEIMENIEKDGYRVYMCLSARVV